MLCFCYQLIFFSSVAFVVFDVVNNCCPLSLCLLCIIIPVTHFVQTSLMLYIPVTNVAGFGVVTEAPAHTHTHSHKHRNAEHILTAPNALCLFLKSVSYLARTYARSIFLRVQGAFWSCRECRVLKNGTLRVMCDVSQTP